MSVREQIRPPVLSERPSCLCGGPMRLTRIEPQLADNRVELRTFECRECGHELKLTVPHLAANK
jgi:hypothetical protein